MLKVHCALWQKKSSRFSTCSPSFPSSYCAQLPCHQHPRGNHGQQAKASKIKSIVWPLEASPPSFFWHGRQAGGQVLPCSHIATCLDRASAPPPGCRYGAAARNFQLGFSFEAFVRAAVEAGWEQRTCCLGALSGFRLKRENYEHNRSVHTHRHNGAGRLWGVRCLERPSIRPQVLPHNHIPNQHIHNQRHNLRLSPPWPGR